MKKIISLCFVMVMMMSLSMVTLAAEPNVLSEKVDTLPLVQEDVSPCIVHSYDKTVVQFYTSYSDIPEMISYKEYNDKYAAWFSGYLYLQNTTRTTTGWNATFSGELIGRV